MGDRHPPQALPNVIQRCQLLPFGLGHAQRAQGRGIVSGMVAVGVEIGQATGEAENFDDPAIIGWNPDGLDPVVVSHRHDTAHREIQEVFDIDIHRFVEAYLLIRGFVGAQFHRVGIADLGRQRTRHGLRTVLAHGVLGSADVQRGQGNTIDRGGCSLAKEQRRLAGAIAVGDDAAPRHLNRGRGAEVNGRDLGIERDQHHVIQHHVILPRRVGLPLRWQIAGLLVIHRQPAAAVDRQIEPAIRPAQGLAEFGMVQNGEGHTRQRLVLLVQHPAANHRAAFRLDSARRDAGLNRVSTGVEEIRRGVMGGGDGGINRRGDGARVGRQRWRDGDAQHPVDHVHHIESVHRAVAVDVGGGQRLDAQHRVDHCNDIEGVDRTIVIDIAGHTGGGRAGDACRTRQHCQHRAH